VHELLQRRDPAGLEWPRAARAARAFVAARWRRWRWLARAVPRDVADELAVSCAWHGLLRDLSAAAPGGEAELAAAAEVVEALGRARPTTLLGVGLGALVERHRLPPLLLLRPLRAVRSGMLVHAWQTRAQLAAHAAELAGPEGRVLLAILGVPSEGAELRADALATGLQLAWWTTHLPEGLAAGHLHLAMEDLARHGASPAELTRGSATPALRAAVLDAIGAARALLAKGWPLCLELGPLRGRELAFFLRWHAAALSALERRGGDPLAGPPPAGLGRLAACLGASLATRAAPFGASAGSGYPRSS